MRFHSGFGGVILAGAGLLLPLPTSGNRPAPAASEVCVLKTDFGTMVFELFEADAPMVEQWTGPDKKMAMHKPVDPVVIRSARIEVR
jgi:hypothetical protein